MTQRYLVQVPHDPDALACANVIRIFLATGSHYLTQADWGCRDGEHTAWMIVKTSSREEARQIVPPPFRAQAHVVRLNKYTFESIETMMREHGGTLQARAV